MKILVGILLGFVLNSAGWELYDYAYIEKGKTCIVQYKATSSTSWSGIVQYKAQEASMYAMLALEDCVNTDNTVTAVLKAVLYRPYFAVEALKRSRE